MSQRHEGTKRGGSPMNSDSRGGGSKSFTRGGVNTNTRSDRNIPNERAQKNGSSRNRHVSRGGATALDLRDKPPTPNQMTTSHLPQVQPQSVQTTQASTSIPPLSPQSLAQTNQSHSIPLAQPLPPSNIELSSIPHSNAHLQQPSNVPLQPVPQSTKGSPFVNSHVGQPAVVEARMIPTAQGALNPNQTVPSTMVTLLPSTVPPQTITTTTPTTNPTNTSFQAPPRTHSAPPNLAEQQQQPHPIYYPEKTNNFAHNYQSVPSHHMAYYPQMYGMPQYVPHMHNPMQMAMNHPHGMQLHGPPRSIPVPKAPMPQPKRVLIIKDPTTGVEYDPLQLLNAPSKVKPAPSVKSTSIPPSSSTALPPPSPSPTPTPLVPALVEPIKSEEPNDQEPRVVEPSQRNVESQTQDMIKSDTNKEHETIMESPKLQEPIEQLNAPQLQNQQETDILAPDSNEDRIETENDRSTSASTTSTPAPISPPSPSTPAPPSPPTPASTPAPPTVASSASTSTSPLLPPSSPTAVELATMQSEEKVSAVRLATEDKDEEEDDWERKGEEELLNLEPRKEREDNSQSRPGDISSVAALSMIPVEFPEGSWKPPTSEKRIYDRSFLLEFQPVCTERPEGLPSMDNILGRDEADFPRENMRGGQQQQRQMSFSGSTRGAAGGRMGPPGLFRFGSDQQLGGRGPPGLAGPHPTAPRGGRDFHSPMDRGGNVGRGPYNQMRRSGEHPGKKQHHQGKQGAMGPQSGANRWERPQLSGDAEKDRVEMILRKARSLLNKLTLEKFDSLSNQLLNIGINNVDVLRGLIGLVFDKALAEPHFSGMYADLCVKMSEKSLEFVDPNATNNEQKQTFRRILLNRCQEEFEVKPQPPPADATELEKEEMEFKRKRKMLGNIKFIGELYKRKMLTEMIMHQCIKLLLGDIKNPSPDNIESLCVLMKKIGKIIDHPKAESYMKEYFQRIKELSTNKNLESRIRFMLEDVIELRSNKWVPRRKDDNPKTIKEIHREAEEKDLMTSAASSAILHSRGGPRGVNNPNVRPNTGNGADRFMNPNPMARNNSRGQSTPLSSPSLKEGRNSNDPIVLGPMGNSMGSGAKGWNVLKSDNEPRSPQSSQKRPQQKQNIQEDEHPRQGTTSNLLSPRDEGQSALSLEAFEEAVGELLQEYLVNHDLQDAILSLSELGAKFTSSDNGFPAAVNKTVATALDCKSADFNLLIELLCSLQQKNIVSSSHIISGLKQVMAGFEDILIDYPKAGHMIGTIIAHLVFKSCVGLSDLDVVFLHLAPLQTLSLISEVFLSLKTLMSEDEIRKMYKRSKLDIEKILATTKRTGAKTDNQLIGYLMEKKLLFLEPSLLVDKELDAWASSNEYTPPNSPSTKLDSFADWIEETIPAESRKEKEFIRKVMRAVLKKVIHVTGGLSVAEKSEEVKQRERDAFRSYSPLLLRFIAKQPPTIKLSLSVSCLFEIQSFVFPYLQKAKGAAERMFRYVLDTGVCSQEVFKMWSNDSTDRTPGKEETLFAVNAFLQSLLTAQTTDDVEDDEEDEEQVSGEE